MTEGSSSPEAQADASGDTPPARPPHPELPDTCPPDGATAGTPAYDRLFSTILQDIHSLDPVLQRGQGTDWVALARSDPALCVETWASFQQARGRADDIAAERTRTLLSAARKTREEGRQKLFEAIPGMKDPGQRKEIHSTITEALNRAGYSGQEADDIPDYRVLLLAWKAAGYDRIQAGREAAEAKRVFPVHTRQQPGGPAQGNSGRITELTRQARLSGNLDDAMAAINAVLRSS